MAIFLTQGRFKISARCAPSTARRNKRRSCACKGAALKKFIGYPPLNQHPAQGLRAGAVGFRDHAFRRHNRGPLASHLLSCLRGSCVKSTPAENPPRPSMSHILTRQSGSPSGREFCGAYFVKDFVGDRTLRLRSSLRPCQGWLPRAPANVAQNPHVCIMLNFSCGYRA